MSRWGALVIAATLAACAHETPRPVPPPPPPRLPDSSRGRHVSVAPPDWYWEPVFADVPSGPVRPIDLPAASDAIVRVEGGVRLWEELGEPGRERLRRDGVVVLGEPASEPRRWHMGVFYNEWRERRVPYVVTLDALFVVVHHALSRAYAEIVERELSPLLDSMLARIDVRLAAEHRGAGVELLGGYRFARGVIAVARALADERHAPTADLAAAVGEEKQRIELAAGWSTSPLLGVPIDYARFAAPRETKPVFRVLTWLSAAPLALVARTEHPAARLDVGTVRHHARAAMLLARLADRDVDPAIHGAFSRLSRFATFAWGPPDDVTPLALGDLADTGGIDLAKADVIANVARVDRLRGLARALESPKLWDGSGGPGAASMRVLGTHAAADSLALASFAHPTALDVAAWLGAPEARAALHEAGADRREGYDETFARVVDTRPPLESSTLHASVHGSLLVALLAWSSARTASSASDRARLESTLASWTLVRHVAGTFGRTKPPGRPATRELRVSGAPIPAFVEPEPDAIARLLGALRQARRGLVALGPMAKGSPGDLALAEAEDLVRVALRAAERTARDEATTAEETTALSGFPARLAALETDLGDEGGPYGAVIHATPSSSHALVSASGAIEPAVVLAREGGSGRLVLAVAAHLAYFEAVERTDRGEAAASMLERRIKDGKATRASWTDGFRLAR